MTEQSRRSWFRGLALVIALSAAIGLAVLAGLRPLGPRLLEITLGAEADADLSNEALEVIVRFPYTDRTRPETLRVTLNGADVTGSFWVAENGAFGQVVLLVDGTNVLRAGVFGEAWWGASQWVEHTVETTFRVRRPIDRFWG